MACSSTLFQEMMGLKKPQNWDEYPRAGPPGWSHTRGTSFSWRRLLQTYLMHNKSDTELCASWVGASFGSRSPHQIAEPWDFNFFAGAQAHPGSPAAHPHTPLEQPCPYFHWWDLAWGHTDAFQDTCFLSRAAAYKPRLLDIFLLTCLNESPNPQAVIPF